MRARLLKKRLSENEGKRRRKRERKANPKEQIPKKAIKNPIKKPQGILCCTVAEIDIEWHIEIPIMFFPNS